MSYGYADEIAAIVAGTPAAGGEKPIPPIDPALYYRDDVRAVLAVRDIGALFRVLEDVGLTQQEIARLTGKAQSEVAEILAGRKIDDYDVLVRIAEGLGIPRKLMGLSYGAYRQEVTVADPLEGMSTEMLCKHMLALGEIAAFGIRSRSRGSRDSVNS
ncbi:MAG: helix-turn-helix transcriptional regulator [Actinomycetota bacterium]|nr:helix-turn-helix transcriptional regulator [Actinomycetota bacterium]